MIKVEKSLEVGKRKSDHANQGCDEQPAVLEHGEHLVPEHVLHVAVETVSSY